MRWSARGFGASPRRRGFGGLPLEPPVAVGYGDDSAVEGFDHVHAEFVLDPPVGFPSHGALRFGARALVHEVHIRFFANPSLAEFRHDVYERLREAALLAARPRVVGEDSVVVAVSLFSCHFWA